jgi:RNA recognition motif-containing protein
MAPLDSMLMTSVPATSQSSLCGATVTVSNLPVEIDESAICRLFAPFGGVQSVYLLPVQRAAVVTMFNYIEALNAVSGLNGLSLNGCVIQVNVTPSNTPAMNITPGCTNPGQVTVIPFGHNMTADNGRLMPYFLPSVGLPSTAGYELAPLAII